MPAQVETDVYLARSVAVAHNRVLRMSFTNSADGSCYVVHTGSAGNCGCGADGTASCQAGTEVIHVVRSGADLPVQLLSNSPFAAFDPVKGTVTPTATVKVLGPSGIAIHQVISIVGRVRSCTPGGAVAGYQRC